MSDLTPNDWLDLQTNDFDPKYEDTRLNEGDIDAELFQRTPNDNDRPMLEKYYKMLPRDENGNIYPIVFYGYITIPKDEKSKKTCIINLVNEFGYHMASHVVVDVNPLKPWVCELVTFQGRIYRYPNKKKYGITILKDTVEAVETHPIIRYEAHWNLLSNYIKSKYLKISDIINNEYIIKDKGLHISMMYESEKILDRISEYMFGISGLIYPMISNLFIMRDDMTNKKELYKYHKHLNILSTLVIDYISYLKPKTYIELLCIVSYLVLNYLGLGVDDPRNKNYSKYFAITIKYMDINPNHAIYHVQNIIKNVGGLKNIQDSVPEEHKLEPETIAKKARIYFARRLLINVPEDRQKYYIDKKFYIEHEDLN